MVRLRFVAGFVVGAVLSAAAVVAAPEAGAGATTITRYPIRAAATSYTGSAVDACTAPPLSTMRAWLASPYRGLGVYVGGENRSCAQPNLTAEWVSAVTAMGWKLLPIYFGRQAPCSDRVHATKISADAGTAAAQGTTAADDARARLTALGMSPGSAIYYDLENYDPDDSGCRTSVLTFLSAWVGQLHTTGYLAAVYANLGSGAKHLAQSYSSDYARPDILWVARWDGSATLTGLAGISDRYWASHQRAKQYRGDHDETYGGVTLNVDTDAVDTAVATVARAYTTELGTTNLRAGPSTSATAITPITAGTPVQVLCQTHGGARLGTEVWDKLSNGRYISDHYVNTPSNSTYSPGIGRCSYPYQVTVADHLSLRKSPSGSSTRLGYLYPGGLAWVKCQRKGATVGATAIWDRLLGNPYVTDHYVATASNTSYTSPIPRCY
jgi:glycoside hydrolase-like protein/SH3 domain-containing protein